MQERLIAHVLVIAFLVTTGMYLQSTGLFEFWMSAAVIFLAVLINSPIRAYDPRSTIPNRFDGIIQAIDEGYVPQNFRERGITLGLLRVIVAFVISIFAAWLMQFSEAKLVEVLGADASYATSLMVLAITTATIFFVIAWLLQPGQENRSLRLNAAIYDAMPAAIKNVAAVRWLLLTRRSRTANALIDALSRAGVAVVVRAAIGGILPHIFVNNFGIAALVLLALIFILIGNVITSALQRLSDVGDSLNARPEAGFTTKAAPEQPTAFAPPAAGTALPYQDPTLARQPAPAPQHIWARDEDGNWT